MPCMCWYEPQDIKSLKLIMDRAFALGNSVCIEQTRKAFEELIGITNAVVPIQVKAAWKYLIKHKSRLIMREKEESPWIYGDVIEWRSMDTVPKNGDTIIGLHQSSWITTIAFCEGNRFEIIGDPWNQSGVYKHEFIGWIPIPKNTKELLHG